MFQFITQQFNNLYSTTVNKNPDLRPGMTDERIFNEYKFSKFSNFCNSKMGY